jgi:hypothetical protein
MSPASSLDLLPPFTACLLLGGASSSTVLMAGLFLSSILTKAVGLSAGEGGVAIGMKENARRKDVTTKISKIQGRRRQDKPKPFFQP